MKKNLKLSLLFATTLIAWGLAIGLSVKSVLKAIKVNQPLATFQAPGTATFTLQNPGKITLWHDYQTIHNGSYFSNEQNLPSGYSFHLQTDSGKPLAPLEPLGMTTTSQVGTTAKSAIGTFTIPIAGSYQLKATGPSAEPRILSLTTGTFGDLFKKITATFAITAVLGITGLVTLILGIVTIFSQPTPLKP